MPKVELFGTASCPSTREMREWLEFRGRDFAEYTTSKLIPPPAPACRRSPVASARCRFSLRTARSSRSAGKAAGA